MTKVMKAAMVAALVMVSAAVSAQFSVNAGYVNTKSSVKGSDALNGITAGVGYDMTIQGGFALAYGLNYTYSWYKITSAGANGDEKATYSDHALDIPVRLKYTYNASDNFKVFGFVGPKFCYGLSGTVTGSSVNAYGKDGGVNPFDIKVGLGVGVDVSKFLVKVGYDFGMLDTRKEVNGVKLTGDAVRNNQFYVTVGYTF